MSQLPMLSNLNVLVVGLEERLAEELLQALGAPAGAVGPAQPASLAESLSILARGEADVVFCSSRPGYAQAVLRQVRSTVPVIVVSREAEFTEWAGAMEDGAADFCHAPFQRDQLLWMLASHVPCRRLAA